MPMASGVRLGAEGRQRGTDTCCGERVRGSHGDAHVHELLAGRPGGDCGAGGDCRNGIAAGM
eukprot:3665494-Prymnesium_polylepis.2